MKHNIMIPVIDGEYRNIFAPEPAVYRGPNTQNFRNGEKYEQWILNDFTVIRDDNGMLHGIGITHPKPPEFVDAFTPCPNMHEAENQLFHATFNGSLDELYRSGRMKEQQNIMNPLDRPDEQAECWAPGIVKAGNMYEMLYSPGGIRRANSPDLYNWTTHGVVIESEYPHIRDPFIFKENGLYYIVYNNFENICQRVTKDFVSFSEEKIIFGSPEVGTNTLRESPIMLKKDGLYYLIFCIYDRQNSAYDNRSYVFVSETPDGFRDKNPVAMLYGHAPEFMCENGKWYMFSVFWPENGLNMTPIKWIDLY